MDKRVGMMGAECKFTRVELWGHLLHASHATDVPRTNLLIKVRRLIEHATVRRHAAHEGKEGRRKEGHSVRSRYTVVASGSCADGDSGMAGRYGCGGGVMYITGFMK